MGMELQTVTEGPITALTRLMTRTVSSALVGGYWTVERASLDLGKAEADVPALVAAHARALAPAAKEWLADRLWLLWKSSPIKPQVEAKAWLHETGRLLRDLPQDILATAIDEAVMKSERGFMPTVGEVRAIADPRFRERNLAKWRLEQVRSYKGRENLATDRRCTPEEAAVIRKEVGILYDDEPVQRENWIPVEQRQAPTREDYIAWGVDPASLGETA